MPESNRTKEKVSRTELEALKRVFHYGPDAWCAGKRTGGAVARMFSRMKARGLVVGPPYGVTLKGQQVIADANLPRGRAHE